MQPGRTCPLRYRYRPEALADVVECSTADVLYIVGGLYGNTEALRTIVDLAEQERQLGRQVELIFNGDFNWFNCDHDSFQSINELVLAHRAITGNVELELSDPEDSAGCGCAYPDEVDDQVVDRSNRIIQRLQQTARDFPELSTRLRDLPRYLSLDFHGVRIAILHGDAESLAGWGLGRSSLENPSSTSMLENWFTRSGADIFACTHTCLPAIKMLDVDGRPRVVCNNGAAGMGNFENDWRGLVTRVAVQARSHAEALGTVHLQDLVIELLPVAFAMEPWRARFLRNWPEQSDAWLSYNSRILKGTALKPSAVRLA
ncbi:hypothetical protein [Allohahella sp. A8]|uniref:hypothetical protein n=1 Tax=Allohahella sp. A8 TaxID=3141461 RepID=UPI000C0AD0A1|nr:hypothetical protein [Hahellaceae bacterium]|tara:strand:+ start:12271 stop:13218 length:948 start_codon:yes stop_codon:yes gene_type:complete